MYKKILVPIALDHRPKTGIALALAKTLLDEPGEIIAVHAIEPIPSYVGSYLPTQMIQEGREAAHTALLAELGGVKGVAVELINGSPGHAITDYADKNGIDLIVITSHQPGLQDYFLGSTAARVVRHAHCAVHVVR